MSLLPSHFSAMIQAEKLMNQTIRIRSLYVTQTLGEKPGVMTDVSLRLGESKRERDKVFSYVKSVFMKWMRLKQVSANLTFSSLGPHAGAEAAHAFSHVTNMVKV